MKHEKQLSIATDFNNIDSYRHPIIEMQQALREARFVISN